jgi:hypothetical protein
MATEELIVPMFYSRNALSSGLASDKAAKILRGDDVFRDLIE